MPPPGRGTGDSRTAAGTARSISLRDSLQSHPPLGPRREAQGARGGLEAGMAAPGCTRPPPQTPLTGRNYQAAQRQHSAAHAEEPAPRSSNALHSVYSCGLTSLQSFAENLLYPETMSLQLEAPVEKPGITGWWSLGKRVTCPAWRETKILPKAPVLSRDSCSPHPSSPQQARGKPRTWGRLVK